MQGRYARSLRETPIDREGFFSIPVQPVLVLLFLWRRGVDTGALAQTSPCRFHAGGALAAHFLWPWALAEIPDLAYYWQRKALPPFADVVGVSRPSGEARA